MTFEFENCLGISDFRRIINDLLTKTKAVEPYQSRISNNTRI